MTPQYTGGGQPSPQSRLAWKAQRLAYRLQELKNASNPVELELIDTLVELSAYSDFSLEDFCAEYTRVEVSTMRSYITAIKMFPPDDRDVADSSKIISVAGWRHAYDNTETERRAGLPKAKTLSIMAQYAECYPEGEWQEIPGSLVRTTLSSLKRKLEYEKALHTGDDDNEPSVNRYQYPEVKVTDIQDDLDRFLLTAGIEDLPVYEPDHDYYVWIELVEKRRSE